MNGVVEVSPDQLRHHALAVDEVAAGVRAQHGTLDVCHVSGGGFGVFFGWMADGFNRTSHALLENLDAQAQLLQRYADGLRDMAQEFEELDALIAHHFTVGDLR